MKIWKYELAIVDEQYANIPAGAKFLDVQMQGACPCLWAMVDEVAPMALHKILIIGTGNPMPNEPGQYVGTFQMYGTLVFHAFVEAVNG